MDDHIINWYDDSEMLHKGLNNLSDEVTELAARIVMLETKVDKILKFLNDCKSS
jgi:hypothetical protein